jgi:hypothetical protein
VLKSLKLNSPPFSISILTFHCAPGHRYSNIPWGVTSIAIKIWFRLYSTDFSQVLLKACFQNI